MSYIKNKLNGGHFSLTQFIIFIVLKIKIYIQISIEESKDIVPLIDLFREGANNLYV